MRFRGRSSRSSKDNFWRALRARETAEAARLAERLAEAERTLETTRATDLEAASRQDRATEQARKLTAAAATIAAARKQEAVAQEEAEACAVSTAGLAEEAAARAAALPALRDEVPRGSCMEYGRQADADRHRQRETEAGRH